MYAAPVAIRVGCQLQEGCFGEGIEPDEHDVKQHLKERGLELGFRS